MAAVRTITKGVRGRATAQSCTMIRTKQTVVGDKAFWGEARPQGIFGAKVLGCVCSGPDWPCGSALFTTPQARSNLRSIMVHVWAMRTSVARFNCDHFPIPPSVDRDCSM